MIALAALPSKHSGLPLQGAVTCLGAIRGKCRELLSFNEDELLSSPVSRKSQGELVPHAAWPQQVANPDICLKTVLLLDGGDDVGMVLSP